MSIGRWALEERVILSYVASVAVAIAVFFAGAAFDTYWHPIAQLEEMPFGVTEVP